MYKRQVPSTRKDFYRSFRNPDGSQHFSEEDIELQYQADVNSFRPYYAMSYYFHELLMLDAGSWFNETSPEQARPAFAEQHQYVSALRDQIAYAEGKKLNRDANGERVISYRIKDKYKDMTLSQIREAMPQSKYMAFVEYDFSNAYVPDPADNGNRPGIYPEFKESWVNLSLIHI